MGCGKTTLGEALAATLGVDFVDLDHYIEASCAMSVSAIFATRGEGAFRAMEREALLELSRRGDVVVACGGGTPCQGGCMEAMLGGGTVVWLTVSEQRLVARLALPGQQAKRPLLAGKSRDELRAFVHTALAAREPFYAKAHFRFDATRIETADETRATAAVLAGRLRALAAPENS